MNHVTYKTVWLWSDTSEPCSIDLDLRWVLSLGHTCFLKYSKYPTIWCTCCILLPAVTAKINFFVFFLFFSLSLSFLFFMARYPVFGLWLPRCRAFETIDGRGCRAPNPQPGEPGCLSLPGTALKHCPARVALPAVPAVACNTFEL